MHSYEEEGKVVNTGQVVEIVRGEREAAGRSFWWPAFLEPAANGVTPGIQSKLRAKFYSKGGEGYDKKRTKW